MVAEKYLKDIKEEGIDTLVLGCTHYPLLKNMLSTFMGNKVNLIDSAIETAKEIRTILGNYSLLKNYGNKVTREFYVTDSPERFVEVGEKFLGEKINFIRKTKLEMEV